MKKLLMLNMSNVKYAVGAALVFWFFSFIIGQYKKAKAEEMSKQINRKEKNGN